MYVRFGTRSQRFNSGNIFLALGVICLLLFVPILFVVNNFVFSDDKAYEDVVELKDDYIAQWSAEDPRLIQHIKENYLEPPQPSSIPYNLNDANRRDWSHKGQSEFVADLLDRKRNGFYIEAGGYDGETYSNSLMFERYYNWSGVLIEPDARNLAVLRSKHRKAWVVRGCLEGGTHPKKMKLFGAMEVGGLDIHMSGPRKFFSKLWRPAKETWVWCFPLLSILKAIGQTKVDYFVLDVEGAEMSVIQGTNWDKIDVSVLQVEYMVFQGAFWDKEQSLARRKAMRDFMDTHLPQFEERGTIFLDIVYAKKNLRHKTTKSN